MMLIKKIELLLYSVRWKNILKKLKLGSFFHSSSAANNVFNHILITVTMFLNQLGSIAWKYKYSKF